MKHLYAILLSAVIWISLDLIAKGAISNPVIYTIFGCSYITFIYWIFGWLK